MWPALHEARDTARMIERELETAVQRSTSWDREVLTDHVDIVLAEWDAVRAQIDAQMRELQAQLDAHRQAIAATSRFVQRHYRIHKE